MQNEFDNIDQLFKKGLENSRVTPPAGVWEGVAASIAGTTSVAATTVGIFGKVILGMAVATGIGVGAYYYSFKSETPGKIITAIAPIEIQKPGSEKTQESLIIPDNQIEQKDTKNKGGIEVAENNTAQQMFVEESPLLISEYRAKWPITKDARPDKYATEFPKQEKSATVLDNDCIHSVKIITSKISENEYDFGVIGGSETMVWYINNHMLASGNNFNYVFPSENQRNYIVKLKVFRPFHCMDSAVEIISIIPGKIGKIILMPDILTPNGDGLNDEYWIDILNVQEFELNIFNANKELVFRSDSPAQHWNGKFGVRDCLSGTYIAVLKYKFAGDKEPRVERKSIILTR